MEELASLHADHVFLRREALEHGYDDRDLRNAVTSHQLAKVRHGAYVSHAVWEAADQVERHRLRSHAVLRSHDVPLALSHTSAAIQHGLRLYRPDLTKVHVVCLDKPLARSTPDIVYHRLPVRALDLEGFDDDVLAVNPTRAAIETASVSDVASGVVVLDGLLDLKEVPLERLLEAFQVYVGPGSRKLQITMRLVREGSESVAESLGRHLFWRHHVPEPRLQFEVHDAHGNLIGRTDYAWPECGVFGEMDGVTKYLRTRRHGETVEDAVIREKKREDLLRELTGWLMIRLIWADLFRPHITAARVRDQLRRGHALLR